MEKLPHRSKHAVREVLELFAVMLRPEIGLLLDRLQAELARSAAAAPGRDCCLESSKALRMRRAEFVPAVVEALQRGCAQSLARSRLSPALVALARPVSGSLSLLDDEATDEDGTLAAIAARHAHRSSLALLLLGQRFGVLYGSPPLAVVDLPIGPHALGIAMANAARRTGLCLHARMLLYRLHDMQLMARYPGFAEAMDACVDRAGILRGLAFVPLRPAAVAAHDGRGRGVQDRVAHDQELPATESRAVQIVNEALESLRQAGTLPETMAPQRNMVISAMAKFLLRHGQDSSEWRMCVDCARAVLEAGRRGESPSAEVRAWIETALRSVGYSGEDALKLASALTSVAVLQQPVASKADGMRSAREQRCHDRLAGLPLGTRLGFSTRGGDFMRSRLRYHYVEPGLLLLANEADGQEALFEIDAVARQMAAGQAWVIRSSPRDSSQVEREPIGGLGMQWPQHARGSEPS